MILNCAPRGRSFNPHVLLATQTYEYRHNHKHKNLGLDSQAQAQLSNLRITKMSLILVQALMIASHLKCIITQPQEDRKKKNKEVGENSNKDELRKSSSEIYSFGFL